jgi:DNA invertase Pin-like site-specific DNA recombinase
MISARTRAALQAAKARGQRLGNPNLDEVRDKAIAATRAAAAAFAEGVLPIIRQLRNDGRGLRQIAKILNERNVPTMRGGRWAPTQISDILRRAEAAKEA